MLLAWLLSPWFLRSGMMKRLGFSSFPDSSEVKDAKFLDDPSRPCRMRTGLASSGLSLATSTWWSFTASLIAARRRPSARFFPWLCCLTVGAVDDAASSRTGPSLVSLVNVDMRRSVDDTRCRSRVVVRILRPHSGMCFRCGAVRGEPGARWDKIRS